VQANATKQDAELVLDLLTQVMAKAKVIKFVQNALQVA
jgi:hypothetical protein